MAFTMEICAMLIIPAVIELVDGFGFKRYFAFIAHNAFK